MDGKTIDLFGITKKSTPKILGVLFPLLDFAHSYRFADESETIKKQAVSRVDAPKEIRVSKLAYETHQNRFQIGVGEYPQNQSSNP